MPFKNKEEQKESQRQHYLKNKELYRDRSRARKNRVKEWYREYKSELECSQCGEDHPACLQFHHSDPSNKHKSVASMVSNGTSKSKIIEEINKCIVLCANCHCKEHIEY